jgi:uncharacterized SAM-binding protein YcdF (DUF218 family)
MMKWIIYFGAVVVLAGCIRTEKLYVKAQAKQPFDAIIVPGVPYDDDSFSQVMTMRVRWAVHLYEKGITKNIIFSGGAVYNEYTECKIMSMYAQGLGVPVECIFLDTLAQHSTENMFYSWHLAQFHRLENVALATDQFQTAMLRSFGRKMKRRLGADITLIPAIIDTLKILPNDAPIIDAASAIDNTPVDIVRTQSKAHRWGGTMGLHIDWDYDPKLMR